MTTKITPRMSFTILNKQMTQINTTERFTAAIDNQRHGLETQAKFLMLLTPHP